MTSSGRLVAGVVVTVAAFLYVCYYVSLSSSPQHVEPRSRLRLRYEVVAICVYEKLAMNTDSGIVAPQIFAVCRKSGTLR